MNYKVSRDDWREEIMKSTNLSNREKVYAFAISTFAWGVRDDKPHNWCCPTVEQIQERAGFPNRNNFKAMRDHLVEVGALTVEAIPTKRYGNDRYEYLLNLDYCVPESHTVCTKSSHTCVPKADTLCTETVHKAPKESPKENPLTKTQKEISEDLLEEVIRDTAPETRDCVPKPHTVDERYEKLEVEGEVTIDDALASLNSLLDTYAMDGLNNEQREQYLDLMEMNV